MYIDEPTMVVRVSVTLPNGKREVFGYNWPEHYAKGLAFTPLPRDREIDPFAMSEANAQRERRRRIADAISRQIADSILEWTEKNDSVRGYEPGSG